MSDYYSDKLSSDRLKRVYDIASPRVQQYLKSEIDYVVDRIKPHDRVLELGCGYGRVIRHLCNKSRLALGIDSSAASVIMAREYLSDLPNVRLSAMNAGSLGFADGRFDVVVCIQNGISAFKLEPGVLVAESIRVTRPGGRVLLSSYSDKFWDYRLEWFEIQANEGLLGEIDYDATGDGVIVCKDGFRATTFDPDDFARLASQLKVEYRIEEVDESSLFCELIV